MKMPEFVHSNRVLLRFLPSLLEKGQNDNDGGSWSGFGLIMKVPRHWKSLLSFVVFLHISINL